MDPLFRKELKNEDDLKNPHVTIFGVGVQRHKDYVILHGVDMETQKEYWIKVSIEEILNVSNTIMDMS